jgi:hypothetical protein
MSHTNFLAGNQLKPGEQLNLLNRYRSELTEIAERVEARARSTA